MLRCFVLILCAYGAVGYGYDSGGGDQASCGRPYRTGRNYQPPCDLAKNGYCVQAGQLYPWRAVKRFVKDNQGLMRRMYGDQRQAHVLRTELDPDILDEEWGEPTRNFNEWREPHHRRYSRHQHDGSEDDLDIDNELSPIPDEETSYANENPYTEPRYLKDDPNTFVDVLKTKFVYSQHEPALVIKLAGLRAASRYRATTQRTTTTTAKVPTTEKTTTTKSTTTKPTASRTFPPRNTNPKNIYSARNTASTTSTTKKPTSARTTTTKITSSTTIKHNSGENKRVPQSNSASSKTKSQPESSTVGTTRGDVYITRDSADTSKKNGKIEATITTEVSSAAGSTESTIFTTEDYLNESTTDPTASPDHLSTTFKTQPQPTTVEETLSQKPSQAHPNPSHEQTATANDRFDLDDDSIEVLSELDSAEKQISDKSIEPLKQTSDLLKGISDLNNNDDTLLSHENDESVESDEDENTKDISAEEDIDEAEVSASETHVNKVDSPVDTVLFQDMEDDTNKKITVNYNMKGVNACPVKEEVVAPFWANNTRGEVLALLNMYPFEQYVHWEKCTFEHRQMYCREGCRCEQQYRLHRLLAYDPNNECRGIFSDWFRFPSCCVCKCYNIPAEFRVTSRSPRLQRTFVEDDLEYEENIA